MLCSPQGRFPGFTGPEQGSPSRTACFSNPRLPCKPFLPVVRAGKGAGEALQQWETMWDGGHS